ncbi:ZFP36 [Symbiodinium natans]|uniref:ZFP36 protein n=1 Tax=Symbiodinium natans TaxID=878477 RepID=A0A812U3V6_9DINO|nr:ZFP36 [Symbiodinium natans]
MSTEPASRKRKAEAEPAEDPGLGGLYDFLPPPDPEKDKATAAKARKAEQLSTRPKLPPVDRSRVIFLDVDGVLLPAGSVEMIFIDGVMLPVRAAKEADFNRTALSNLRAIVQQTGASIVLSSEWRRKEEMRDNIRRTLQAQDIPGVQDSTPIFQPSAELVKQRLDQAIIWAERRAREIGSWLKQHKEVKAWVAIDDIDFSWADSVKVSGTPLMKHRTVLTNPKYCITEKDAEEAVRILLNPPVIAPGEEADAIAAARYLTEEALAKCAGAGLM